MEYAAGLDIYSEGKFMGYYPFWRDYINVRALSEDDLRSEINKLQEVVVRSYTKLNELNNLLDKHKNGYRSTKIKSEIDICTKERVLILDRFNKLQLEMGRRKRSRR